MTRPVAELLCPDLPRSLRYYTQVLGAAVLDEADGEALLELARSVLSLRRADQPLGYPAGDGLTLVLPTDDVAAMAATAEAYGARLVEPLAAGAFALMDPDGYRLRFVEA